MLDSLPGGQETRSVFTARSMVARKSPDSRGFEESELLYKSIHGWTEKTI